MKSKIQFDLNGQGEAVISAQITFSEDVRDKVAKSIVEKLSCEGNIAIVTPVFRGSEEDINTSSIWEIKTLSPYKEDCEYLTKRMGSYPLELLSKAILKELELRKRGAFQISDYGLNNKVEMNSVRNEPYIEPTLYRKVAVSDRLPKDGETVITIDSENNAFTYKIIADQKINEHHWNMVKAKDNLSINFWLEPIM